MSDQFIKQKDKSTIHRAPLIVPIEGPVIENGAILITDNVITEVDKFKRVKVINANIIDHEDSVLVPGLINCHSHLELSYLSDLGQVNSYFQPGDITSWIYELIQKRFSSVVSIEQQLKCARIELEKMYDCGVVAVADIGNNCLSHKIGLKSQINVQFFLESFGLSLSEVENVQKELSDHKNFAFTGHALYSTNPELLISTKNRANLRGDFFPIHVAESADEIEFLKTGKGRFEKFLNKRLTESGVEPDVSLSDIFNPPQCGAVEYLDKLNILDSNTLCVHAVHVDDNEINLLANRKANVCLCPASNKFLGVGEAPVIKFIRSGVNTCIGTDSLASNSSLNLWCEMKILFDDAPDLDPKTIFRMATLNGAQALGINSTYGSLISGKKGPFLSVKGLSLNKNKIYENLVHSGVDAKIQMIGGLHAK